MADQIAQNSFTGGLVQDLSPFNTANTFLTDCLNGTILTNNGNEYVLLNDMGNRRIGTNVTLSPGYIPIGMKAYNGIIYIVSKNPKTNKCEIGSFPSPVFNINELDPIITPMTYYSKILFEEKTFRQGDNFNIQLSLQNPKLNDLWEYVEYDDICPDNCISGSKLKNKYTIKLDLIKDRSLIEIPLTNSDIKALFSDKGYSHTLDVNEKGQLKLSIIRNKLDSQKMELSGYIINKSNDNLEELYILINAYYNCLNNVSDKLNKESPYIIDELNLKKDNTLPWNVSIQFIKNKKLIGVPVTKSLSTNPNENIYNNKLALFNLTDLLQINLNEFKVNENSISTQYKINEDTISEYSLQLTFFTTKGNVDTFTKIIPLNYFNSYLNINIDEYNYDYQNNKFDINIKISYVCGDYNNIILTPLLKPNYSGEFISLPSFEQISISPGVTIQTINFSIDLENYPEIQDSNYFELVFIDNLNTSTYYEILNLFLFKDNIYSESTNNYKANLIPLNFSINHPQIENINGGILNKYYEGYKGYTHILKETYTKQENSNNFDIVSSSYIESNDQLQSYKESNLNDKFIPIVSETNSNYINVLYGYNYSKQNFLHLVTSLSNIKLQNFSITSSIKENANIIPIQVEATSKEHNGIYNQKIKYLYFTINYNYVIDGTYYDVKEATPNIDLEDLLGVSIGALTGGIIGGAIGGAIDLLTDDIRKASGYVYNGTINPEKSKLTITCDHTSNDISDAHENFTDYSVSCDKNNITSIVKEYIQSHLPNNFDYSSNIILCNIIINKFDDSNRLMFKNNQDKIIYDIGAITQGAPPYDSDHYNQYVPIYSLKRFERLFSSDSDNFNQIQTFVIYLNDKLYVIKQTGDYTYNHIQRILYPEEISRDYRKPVKFNGYSGIWRNGHKLDEIKRPNIFKKENKKIYLNSPNTLNVNITIPIEYENITAKFINLNITQIKNNNIYKGVNGAWQNPEKNNLYLNFGLIDYYTNIQTDINIYNSYSNTPHFVFYNNEYLVTPIKYKKYSQTFISDIYEESYEIILDQTESKLYASYDESEIITYESNNPNTSTHHFGSTTVEGTFTTKTIHSIDYIINSHDELISIVSDNNVNLSPKIAIMKLPGTAKNFEILDSITLYFDGTCNINPCADALVDTFYESRGGNISQR